MESGTRPRFQCKHSPRPNSNGNFPKCRVSHTVLGFETRDSEFTGLSDCKDSWQIGIITEWHWHLKENSSEVVHLPFVSSGQSAYGNGYPTSSAQSLAGLIFLNVL